MQESRFDFSFYLKRRNEIFCFIFFIAGCVLTFYRFVRDLNIFQIGIVLFILKAGIALQSGFVTVGFGQVTACSLSARSRLSHTGFETTHLSFRSISVSVPPSVYFIF